VPEPARLPGVDPGFERRLIDGIRPISELFLASGLHHLFSTGLYDHLVSAGGATPVDAVAEDLALTPARLRGFLLYLANEDIVTVAVDGNGRETVALTERARGYAEFRAWYTFLVGGYATTLEQLGGALGAGRPACTRNGRDVGVGSCEIAHFDGMPMLQTLLEDAGIVPRTMLDLGCGDGRYLVELCRRFPEATAWGAEPDPAAFKQAEELVRAEGLGDRIELVEASAEEFLAAHPPGCRPDVVVFGYVLQEILGQRDRETVVGLLRSLVAAFPEIAIAVVEVADQIANPAVMGHGLARNFWNLYYLVHYFTDQRLETREFWEALFEEAGLAWEGLVTTPTPVDSTGLELGYLLHRRTAAVAS
jgi:2-ketoarginine methyltransferase